MKWILITALLLGCAAPEEKDSATDTTATPLETPTPIAEEECFLRVTGRDSLRLSYTADGDNISGRMMYDNYQKDGSWGTVKGMLEGGLLKVWYDFEAEGMRSVRRIIFRVEKDHLLPATGELVVRGDSSLYVDEGKLEFEKEGALQRVECGVLRFTF